MEHSWTIEGCYANWTLTLTAEPLDGADAVDVSISDFHSLDEHFSVAVNYVEVSKDLERVGSGPWRQLG